MKKLLLCVLCLTMCTACSTKEVLNFMSEHFDITGRSDKEYTKDKYQQSIAGQRNE